jgi:hypothetical protein
VSDVVLTQEQRQEALSVAYVHAVAAGAGYAISALNYDMLGVDLTIRAKGPMRPLLDIQLKATVNLGEPTDGAFRFPLKRGNYDSLREPGTPQLLVVLDLPPEEDRWIEVSPERLIVRRCAFWASPRDWGETSNACSVTISIPEANRFDVTSLRALMEQARSGGSIR